MEAAVPTDGGSSSDGLPWERPVREITLAARSDVIDEMRDPWSKYLSAINDCAKQFSAIWTDYLEKHWRGEAAHACYVEWQHLYVEITNFAKNYASVDGALKNAEKAVIEARETIPVPVFNGGRLPGNIDAGVGSAADLKVSGGDLYSDYQESSESYADFAFLHHAKRELSDGETPVGVRAHTKSGYGVNGTVEAYEKPALTSKEKQVREQAVQEWYHTHQSTANVARDNLLTDYAHSKSSLPKPYGGFIYADDSEEKKKDPGGRYLPGGGDGSGAAYGAGSFGAVGGAGLGAGAVHASLPMTRHAALPSPPSSIADGIRLAGDPDPSAVGTAGGTALSGGNSRLPLSWSTAPAGGAGGAGSFGAVGAGGIGGGFGSVGVPGTSTPGEGWWNRPRSGPVGPAASSPAAQLAAARGGTSAAGSSGVGMMPHGGGSASKQREERQTWLTEDDKDVFRAKPATPGLIE
ncbi:hypothetical protein Athai_54870 [Actinocatenispora thailandica]|uniref:PPE family domain-containing protein n=1 Tax=Actinocatenispora thailandica TaxID=227318 RepID=A0A7R7I011_9ACTN|nr:hypothetical protein [Actinocatenispora thailandica]BCJ37984.1 hypothetical protein Athai_54870 [Actinocatenispora thailandica]